MSELLSDIILLIKIVFLQENISFNYQMGILESFVPQV